MYIDELPLCCCQLASGFLCLRQVTNTQFQVEATVSVPTHVFLRVPADLISVFHSVYPDFLLSDVGESKYLSFCSQV